MSRDNWDSAVYRSQPYVNRKNNSVSATLSNSSEESRDGIKVYRRLLSLALPHWRIFLLGILAMIANGLADTAFAWIIKPLMDDGFVARDPQSIQYIPLAIFAIFALRGMTSFLSSYCISWVGRRVVAQRHDYNGGRNLQRHIPDRSGME